MKHRATAALRALAHARIAAKELPCSELPRIWGGTASGETCSLCLEVVHAPMKVYEVEIPLDHCVASRTLHFHLECYDAWVWACRDRPLASAS